MSESNFEEKISQLKEMRAELVRSDSFDRITELWSAVKKTYAECSAIVEDVEKQLQDLDVPDNLGDALTLELESMKFADAMQEMQQLSEEVKNVSFSKMPELIARIQVLKAFCFRKLAEEKVKMEEIA